ncbi:hypothetical protein E2542_SST17124 [Spatholobus suberectus]|nr:hypothetical protein E2542_SST17124 [Spatholobus suberectus]
MEEGKKIIRKAPCKLAPPVMEGGKILNMSHITGSPRRNISMPECEKVVGARKLLELGRKTLVTLFRCQQHLVTYLKAFGHHVKALRSQLG